ncbi:MAG: hypothetical protein IPO67_27145 [Deltaproteobacteria bacterium]|nr:hypothetical protein [Deltaproteobacteria bacterium]
MFRRDQLTLTLTAALGACSDPVIGDWELSALNSEPLTYTSYLSGPYGYGCGEYVREVVDSYAGLLHIGAELDASLSLEHTFKYYLTIEGCGEEVDIQQTNLYTYSGAATEQRRRGLSDPAQVRLQRCDAPHLHLERRLSGL